MNTLLDNLLLRGFPNQTDRVVCRSKLACSITFLIQTDTAHRQQQQSDARDGFLFSSLAAGSIFSSPPPPLSYRSEGRSPSSVAVVRGSSRRGGGGNKSADKEIDFSPPSVGFAFLPSGFGITNLFLPLWRVTSLSLFMAHVV